MQGKTNGNYRELFTNNKSTTGSTSDHHRLITENDRTALADIVESGPPPHHSGGPFEVVNLFRLSVSTFNYDTLSVGVHQLSPNASPIDRLLVEWSGGKSRSEHRLICLTILKESYTKFVFVLMQSRRWILNIIELARKKHNITLIVYNKRIGIEY